MRGLFWVSVKNMNRIFFVLPALLLSACSGGNNSSNPKGAYIYQYDNKDEVAKAISRFQVQCQGPCPESAGVLLIQTSSALGTCSFSLVDAKTILTNRHCVPDTIAQAGASCQGVIQAIFKTTGGAQESFECDQVISVPSEWDGEKKDQRDFAFLTLKKAPARKALKIDISGLQDREGVTALTATPNKNAARPGSTLMAKLCTTHMNSMVNFHFTHSLKAVVAFKDCEIVPGNSGSALISADGQVKAVAQAYLSPSAKKDTTANPLAAKFQTVLAKNHFALGSNMACVENAAMGLLGTHCNKDTDSYSLPLKPEENEQKIRAEVEALLAPLNQSELVTYNAVFENASEKKASENSTLLKIRLAPTCLKKEVKSPLRAKTLTLRYFIDLDADARLNLQKEVLSETNTYDLKLCGS